MSIKSAEDGPSRSALDLDPEAQAVMEMMGKNPKFHNLKEFLFIQFE